MAAMKPIWALLLSCGASILLYVITSVWFLDKPITFGSIDRMMARKVAYAGAQVGPKIVLIGGSGVRTSHHCAVIGPIVELPCVNGGTTVGLSLDYVFGRFKPLLRPGDVVYLPLEYQQYLITRSAMLTGPDAAMLFRSDWNALAERGPEGFARAMFMVDFEFVVQSVIEQLLNLLGVSARFDKQQSNIFGDQVDLTHAKGLRFDPILQSDPWRPPTPQQFGEARGAKDAIAAFLKWCSDHEVHVIGGLPVSFSDQSLNPALIHQIREFYMKNGAEFLMMNNHSQYERTFFFDSPFHLEEGAAILHSRMLAQKLAALPHIKRARATYGGYRPSLNR